MKCERIASGKETSPAYQPHKSKCPKPTNPLPSHILYSNNLWRQTIRRVKRRLSDISYLFRKLEIRDVAKSFRDDEKAFGLLAWVDDVFVVEVVEGQDDVGGVEASYVVGKAL